MEFTNDEASTLIQRIYAVDGALDADSFAALLSQDVTFQMGSASPVIGREAVRKAVQALFSSLRGVHHDLVSYWTGNGKLVFQGEVTFTLLDDCKVVLPYVDVLKRANDGLISDYRIFIDAAPLKAIVG